MTHSTIIYFFIIVHSLYRAETQDEAIERFEAFTHRVPNFVAMVQQYYNIPGIQKICDLLAENPSWSLAHMIAYFNLVEYLSNPNVAELIDYPDHEKYMTPFQLAIKSKNLEMVKALLHAVKLDHLDYDSNGIFHYAANTSKEMIAILTSKTTSHLNHINLEGITPLHKACMSNNPACVHALLCAGADCNISARHVNGSGSGGNQQQIRQASMSSPTTSTSTMAEYIQTNPNKICIQDIKNGGTPLHWASSREVLDALIQRGCHIDALDFNGRSALHIMVSKNQLECVVSLLAHEADIDMKDKDGNTPLHIAVEKKFIPIVQCLVVFGCDINIKNKHDQTSRHMVGREASGSNDDMILYILHSVGAKRCPETSTKCPPGCNAKGVYNGIPPAQPETTEQREAIQQMLAATTSQFSRGRNSLPSIINQQLRFPKDQPTLIDTSAEQKGASVMDALLGMFTSKIQAAAKKEVSSCDKGTSTVEDENDEKMQEDEETASSEEESDCQVGRGRLLCLDGGGIRGLVLVQMLLEIEQLSQTPINYLFDWIAGTSTGGILALAIGSGKTMKQCMCLYLRMKDSAFVGSRPYSSDPLETVLKESLGEYTVMSEIKHPKIMVSAVMADRKPVDLHLFKNYNSASDILGITTPSNNRRIPPPPPGQ